MLRNTHFRQFAACFFGIVTLGSLISFYMASIRPYFSLTMTELDIVTESATSSIVKDLRGKEPYMTFKMKCFYCDDDDYGESWKSVTYNRQCQDSIFDTCFRNKTVLGRHETHVLALYRYCEIERCSCTDSAGWCYSNQCGSQIVRCCLDVRKESLLC